MNDHIEQASRRSAEERSAGGSGQSGASSLGKDAPAERTLSASPVPPLQAEGRGVVAHSAPPPPDTIMGLLFLAARDPGFDVAKFEVLAKLQERAEDRQAEIEFNRALARLPSMRVRKNGRVDLGAGKGSYPFARWEDITKIIEPMLSAEGFKLTFDSAPRQADGGGLIVTGTLLHRDGHSRSASMPLALDSGPGRNNLQAMGSTLSYGKRYCAEMLLNIVREGDDDDGQGANELITDEECNELSVGLTETRSDLNAFLAFMGVAAIPDIQKRDLTRARNAIAQKRQRVKS